jgi:putative membrane protein
MMYVWTGHWGIGGWLAMGLGMLAVWVLAAAGIVWLVHYLADRRIAAAPAAPSDATSHPTRPSAQEILDARYARGEIDEDEYRRRRDTLNSG